MTAGYLDTNIVVGFFKGDTAVKSALERFDTLKIPAAAYIEFMVGLKSEAQRIAVGEVMKALFEIVQTDMRVCEEAAELRRTTRLKLPDAMIYATARIHGGTLITRDKDFDAGAGDIYVPL